MKRSVLIIFFAALAALFIWLLFSRAELSFLPQMRHSARTIVPSANNDPGEESAVKEESTAYDESKQQPLITLDNGETFLRAISVDLNHDGTPDQICALKKASESNIYLVPGIQNPVTGAYARLAAIRTGITQARTLLIYSLDIIGDRTNAIVYSGMTEDNMQLLAVCLPMTESDGKLNFTAIADLRADGPITIQETGRSDAYNLGLTSGESFPIYAYNSDPDAPQTLNQIERIYRWDKTLKRYAQASESHIEGKKIETKLMHQIQGGNVESFNGFLTGVWYIASSSAQSDTKYIFFDPQAKEIIFHAGSTEEVFVQEAGTLRHNGAYLTTRNRSIPSISRLIDVELTGIDEIRVNVQEDVKLKIGVASDWDGIYRKMGTSQTSAGQETALKTGKIREMLASSPTTWISPDGQALGLAENRYTLTRPSGIESGLYALITVGGKTVFQFKSEKDKRKSSFYLVDVQMNPTTAGEQQTLTLTEVTVTIDGTNLAGSPPIVFNRKK